MEEKDSADDSSMDPVLGQTGLRFDEFVTLFTGLPFEGTDDASFAVDRGLEVCLSAEPNDAIALHAIVFQADGEVPAWLQREVCLANYGCAGTGGATLGIHFSRGGVLLTRILPFANRATAGELLREGWQFVEMAIHWKKRLERRHAEEFSGNGSSSSVEGMPEWHSKSFHLRA
jgi:hypothetical protein